MCDIKIEISLDDYIEILNERRKTIPWPIPDIVWDYFIEMLEDGCVPADTTPSFVVDNIAVNGDYGEFDDYMEENETDEEFVLRASDNCLAIFPEERYVIWSL